MKSLGASCRSGIVALLLSLALGVGAPAEGASAAGCRKVKILFPGGEAVVALLDTPLAEEFARPLPLEVEFSDFAGAEKIFYLPEKLGLSGAVDADTQKGDVCYYAPWGNMAVFYKGYGHGKNLYAVGNLEAGKEQLAAMQENFRARIEALPERECR